MSQLNEKLKVSIQMLGYFDILYKEKSILLDVGNSAKSLDILKFLLAQRNVVFSPEAIAENVWPDNDYLEPKKVVRTYIHRLRKMINFENRYEMDFSSDIQILNVKGSYKLELSEDVVLDTDVFERLCATVTEVNDCSGLASVFENVIGIYNRKFLEDHRADDWVVMFRNYYLRTFCTAVNNILEKLEARREYQIILDICEKSLKVYDLDESINIYFLNALISTDQMSNAVQHYSFVTEKMHNTLSIVPSDKMKSVHSRLQTDKDLPVNNVYNARGSHMLKEVINELIRESLSESKNAFAAGFVRITSQIAERKSGEDLKRALESALRKRDMYTIIGENTAIIVLSDAREEYFPNISERIKKAFSMDTDGVEIEIYPLTGIK